MLCSIAWSSNVHKLSCVLAFALLSTEYRLLLSLLCICVWQTALLCVHSVPVPSISYWSDEIWTKCQLSVWNARSDDCTVLTVWSSRNYFCQCVLNLCNDWWTDGRSHKLCISGVVVCCVVDRARRRPSLEACVISGRSWGHLASVMKISNCLPTLNTGLATSQHSPIRTWRPWEWRSVLIILLLGLYVKCKHSTLI